MYDDGTSFGCAAVLVVWWLAVVHLYMCGWYGMTWTVVGDGGQGMHGINIFLKNTLHVHVYGRYGRVASKVPSLWPM